MTIFRKRLTAVAALTVAMFVFAGPALAGWEATTWGMTPEQVQAAMPGTRPFRHSRDYNGMRKRVIGPYQLNGATVDAMYYFDEQGLGRVSMTAPPAKCEDLGRDLIARYGQPLLVRDEVIIRSFIWHDEAAETRVLLVASPANVCNLFFDRLATYRDNDLAEVQRR